MDTEDLTSSAGLNPRRSNSMGSLADSDSYMNSVWPRVATTSTQVCVMRWVVYFLQPRVVKVASNIRAYTLVTMTRSEV